MIVPESGRSIAPIRCSRVDLPDPDAPVSERARLDRQADVVGGGHLLVPADPVVLADVPQLDRATGGDAVGHVVHSSASRYATGRRWSSWAGSSAAPAVISTPSAATQAAS